MGNFLSGALASARSRLSPIFFRTRSYAALQAADLDWIIGPGYSLGGYILEKKHEKPTWTYAILSRIKICRDLRTFWRSLGKKKCLFGSKTVFLGQEVHYYMVYIAYYTELN